MLRGRTRSARSLLSGTRTPMSPAKRAASTNCARTASRWVKQRRIISVLFILCSCWFLLRSFLLWFDVAWLPSALGTAMVCVSFRFFDWGVSLFPWHLIVFLLSSIFAFSSFLLFLSFSSWFFFSFFFFLFSFFLSSLFFLSFPFFFFFFSFFLFLSIFVFLPGVLDLSTVVSTVSLSVRGSPKSVNFTTYTTCGTIPTWRRGGRHVRPRGPIRDGQIQSQLPHSWYRSWRQGYLVPHPIHRWSERKRKEKERKEEEESVAEKEEERKKKEREERKDGFIAIALFHHEHKATKRNCKVSILKQTKLDDLDRTRSPSKPLVVVVVGDTRWMHVCRWKVPVEDNRPVHLLVKRPGVLRKGWLRRQTKVHNRCEMAL